MITLNNPIIQKYAIKYLFQRPKNKLNI